MSKVNINVAVQYYDENGKPKGCSGFRIEGVSEFAAMADYEEREEAIKALLEDYSKGWAGRYEYVSHEIDVWDIVKLDATKFEKLMQS